MSVSQFPVVLMKSAVMDLRQRKRRQITTIVTHPFAVWDRMFALLLRLRRRNIDIFYKIWGDVLSEVFNMKPTSLIGPLGLNARMASRFMYVPRLLPPIRTYVTDNRYLDDPDLALMPALQTWPT